MTDPPPEITPDERAAFDQYVKELTQLGTPPKADPTPTGPKPVTDAEWDKMSDRQRESWVRQLVDGRLDDLAREDQLSRHEQGHFVADFLRHPLAAMSRVMSFKTHS